MSQIQETLEIDVPVRTAYNQWTQFEEFPRFMRGIDQVRQLDATRVRWVAHIAGVRREWDAEILEQVPDSRVAWRNIDGATNGGTVTFEPVSGQATKVTLALDFEPSGLLESVGDSLGLVAARAGEDLEHFRDFITARGAETGAWRGEITGDSAQPHQG